MSSCAITTTATQTCVVCPEVPAITAVPARTDVDPRVGWNASAHSHAVHAGNCHLKFNAPSVTGVVLGLARERISNDPVGVQHGFYLYQSAGRDWYVVIENGVPQTAPGVRRVALDQYRIVRDGATVRYYRNSRLLRTSLQPSHGDVMVVACLYTAPDGVN